MDEDIKGPGLAYEAYATQRYKERQYWDRFYRKCVKEGLMLASEIDWSGHGGSGPYKLPIKKRRMKIRPRKSNIKE